MHKVPLSNVKKGNYIQNFRGTKFNRLLIILYFRAVLMYDTENSRSLNEVNNEPRSQGQS